MESYVLAFSTDGSTWQHYTEDGVVKVIIDYSPLHVGATYLHWTAGLCLRVPCYNYVNFFFDDYVCSWHTQKSSISNTQIHLKFFQLDLSYNALCVEHDLREQLSYRGLGYRATSKHEESWDDSRSLCKPDIASPKPGRV